MNTRKIQRHRRAVLVLSALCVAIANAANAPVTVDVDANANRHPISPAIYGVAFASTAQLNDLNAPVNRQGGNNASRYNWQANASNHDFDWYFESIDEGGPTPGGAVDSFIADTHAASAQPMVTIPMLDWVGKLAANRDKLASFSQAKYGAQTGNDWQWYPDAGNGVLASTGHEITGNDPNDANAPAGVAFEQSWVQHLLGKWGTSASGGLKYYILDNEHSIWHSTHRDVHPAGATMAEIRQKMIDYGLMIRAADGGATIVGPEEWGWSGYLLSGYDQQYGSQHGWGINPDKANNHTSLDYMPWLLDQLHQYDVAHGTRVIDVFSLHYYPQGGEYGNDTSSGMQQRRNRSTRSLWDPAYVDETWIGDKVQLIPRMKNWVATYYPGLKTAITEYNWGAEAHINGATAQADVYGIFGREGLDIGARWTTPDASTPTYKAMKMYRNVDGAKHGFGDMSVAASVPNAVVDNLSAFAATRTSDGALTVMLVSKVLTGTTPVTVHLGNFAAAGPAHAWQLTSSNAITPIADVPVSGGNLSIAALPPQSVTLLVVPGGSGNMPPTVMAKATPNGGIAPLLVRFSSAGSTDGDGSIASWLWNLRDGPNSTAANPSHTYTVPGVYNTKLTVTDNAGAMASKTVVVTITDGTGPIPAPAMLAIHVAPGGKINATWQDKSFNEQGFAIERAASPSGTYAEVGRVGTNVTQFVQTGVPAGTWLYRVRAYNTTTGVYSPYGNVVTATVH